MKKTIKKMLGITAAAALTLSMGSMALIGCGGGAKNYDLEAEHAVITDGTADDQQGAGPQPVHVTVESGNEYTGDPAKLGAEVTNVGYFAGTGTKLTWTVTADKDCEATVYIRAASAMDFMSMMMGGELFPDYELSENKFFKLTVNESDVALSGTIKGLPGVSFEQMSDPTIYKNFTLSAGNKINLKKGENTIVLASTTTGSGGANIDKIVIKSSAKLTYTPADNSDREVSYGG